MTELQNELGKIFKLVSAIPVSGDSVEIMASVRELLRNVYKLAGEAVSDGG